MPEYQFACDACEYSFEVFMSIKDYKALKKCPQCKKNKLYRVYNPVYGFNAEPKTLGSFVDKKMQNMGQYEKDKVEREERGRRSRSGKTEKPKRPPWRKSDKPNFKLANLTPEQKTKYIVEGKL